MYCTHCGSRIDDDSLVCSECGEKVEVFENIQVDQQVQNINDNKKYNFKSNKKIKIIIGTILIFLSIIIFIGINQSNKYKELVGTWENANVDSYKTETFEFFNRNVTYNYKNNDYYTIEDEKYYESSYKCSGMVKNKGVLTLKDREYTLTSEPVKYYYYIYIENGEKYLELTDYYNGQMFTGTYLFRFVQ